jgi:hypothetical protein
MTDCLEDHDNIPGLVGLLKAMLSDPDGPDAWVARWRARCDAEYAEYVRQHAGEAEAEQRRADERERERLRNLLGIGPTGSEGGAAPKPERSKRKRKPNVARFIKDARKAGEKGVVRVSVTDPNGYTTTVSSGNQEQGSDAISANPWDEVSDRAMH